jgi:hypothetical protein
MTDARQCGGQEQLTTLLPYKEERVKVRFNVVSESVGELERDKDLVEDKLLRVSRIYQHTQTHPLVHLYVMATCVIRGKVVYMRQFCGQMFEPHPWTDREPTAQERIAERIQQTLKQEALRLGLTVRAGIIEE